MKRFSLIVMAVLCGWMVHAQTNAPRRFPGQCDNQFARRAASAARADADSCGQRGF